MIRGLLSVFLLAATFLATSGATQARVIQETFEINFSVAGDARSAHQRGSAVNFDADLMVRMGTLLGDPVISLRMRPHLIGGVVTLPRFEPGEEPYETRNIEMLPSGARAQIGLYDVQISFGFDRPGRSRAWIAVDAGYFPRTGEWSFNVPGAYDWGRLFTESSERDATDFLSESAARELWRDGPQIAEVRVALARLSLSDLHYWWRDTNDEPRYIAAESAVKRLLEGLNLSYGYSVDLTYGQTPEIWDMRSGGSSAQFDRILQSLGIETREGDPRGYLVAFTHAANRGEEAIAKLSSIPARLRGGNNHAPYRQAVADARGIVSAVANMRAGFRAEGPDLSGLPEGRPARFDGAYETAEIDQETWLVDSTGQRVRRMPFRGVLISGMSILTPSAFCNDSNTQAAVEIRDAMTDQIERSLRLPCPSAGTLNKFGDVRIEPILEGGVEIGALIVVVNDTGVMTGTPPERCSGRKSVSFRVTEHLYRVDIPGGEPVAAGTRSGEAYEEMGDVICLRRG